VDRAVELISRKSSKPIYYYEFTYQGRYSFYYLPGTNNTVPNGTYNQKLFFMLINKIVAGVAHHDDLLYLYYISIAFPFFGPNSPESKMIEKMTSMWAQFAETG
jgi:hypothetical protein